MACKVKSSPYYGGYYGMALGFWFTGVKCLRVLLAESVCNMQWMLNLTR